MSAYLVPLLTVSLGLNAPSLADMPTDLRSAAFSSHSLWAGRPSNLGYPRDGTRRGGGSRGGVCDLSPGTSPLTALMPDTATWTDEVQPTLPDIVYSLTQQPAPDLWIYLPYRLEEASQLRFTLKDDAGNQLVRGQLDPTEPLPAATHIMEVALGDLGVNLSPDRDYHWYVTVTCGQGPPVVVDGWLKHQPERSDEDPSHGFFVDDLSSLAQSQQTNPDDGAAQSAWQELLNAVGLEDIAAAPIADCCRFIKLPQN